jgi:hypothetical protein
MKGQMKKDLQLKNLMEFVGSIAETAIANLVLIANFDMKKLTHQKGIKGLDFPSRTKRKSTH